MKLPPIYSSSVDPTRLSIVSTEVRYWEKKQDYLGKIKTQECSNHRVC